MNTDKKSIPITSVHLEKMIDGNVEHFDIEFNALGEVLKVENDALDLPDAAKLMIHGRLMTNELRQLMVAVREFKHIFPMIASGLVTAEDLPKRLIPVHDALEKLRKNIEVELDSTQIQNPWTKAFYASPHEEKFRYFFKLFLLDEKKSPSNHQLFDQLYGLVEDSIFRQQLEANDDFANTYLLCIFLQLQELYYTETMDWSVDYTNLESVIDYSKVGMDPKDQNAILKWIHQNQSLPFMEKLVNYKIEDEVLNGLLNTFVHKMIRGTRNI